MELRPGTQPSSPGLGYSCGHPEQANLILKSLVAPQKLLDGLVTVLTTLETFNFSFKALYMLLSSGIVSLLSFSVIGSLASKL
ncbi:hypothetical protein VB005_02347 [Metarhizium brunneum]